MCFPRRDRAQLTAEVSPDTLNPKPIFEGEYISGFLAKEHAVAGLAVQSKQQETGTQVFKQLTAW